MLINYQYIFSPLGALTLISNGQQLLGLLFDHSLESRYIQRIARLTDVPLIEWQCQTDHVIQQTEQQLIAYTKGCRQEFDLELELLGSDFQKRVWQALLDIPYGEVRSYQQIANIIGQPNAVRAVANANGANAIAIIVPCHRVIGSDGKLGGYSGGLDIKDRLLAIEGLAFSR